MSTANPQATTSYELQEIRSLVFDSAIFMVHETDLLLTNTTCAHESPPVSGPDRCNCHKVAIRRLIYVQQVLSAAIRRSYRKQIHKEELPAAVTTHEFFIFFRKLHTEGTFCPREVIISRAPEVEHRDVWKLLHCCVAGPGSAEDGIEVVNIHRKLLTGPVDEPLLRPIGTPTLFLRAVPPMQLSILSPHLRSYTLIINVAMKIRPRSSMHHLIKLVNCRAGHLVGVVQFDSIAQLVWPKSKRTANDVLPCPRTFNTNWGISGTGASSRTAYTLDAQRSVTTVVYEDRRVAGYHIVRVLALSGCVRSAVSVYQRCRSISVGRHVGYSLYPSRAQWI
jgi:hypothetical protein